MLLLLLSTFRYISHHISQTRKLCQSFQKPLKENNHLYHLTKKKFFFAFKIKLSILMMFSQIIFSFRINPLTLLRWAGGCQRCKFNAFQSALFSFQGLGEENVLVGGMYNILSVLLIFHFSTFYIKLIELNGDYR